MLVCPSCHTGVAMPFAMPPSMPPCPWSQKTMPRPPPPPYVCGNIFHAGGMEGINTSAALVPAPGVPCHVLYCLACAQACTHLYPGLQQQQQTTTTCTHQYPTHLRCLAQPTGVACPKTLSCSSENRPSLHKSGGVCTEGSGEGSGERRRSITPEAVVSLPPNVPLVTGCSLLQPSSLFRPDSINDITLKFSPVKENNLNNLNNVWTDAKDIQCLAVCQSQLEESGWYYGALSWQKAAEMLKDSVVGTFLVRDSASPHCRYSLSVQTANGPTSVRIHYSKGKFRLDCAGHSTRTSPDSSSVVELMETYVNEHSKLVWVDHEGKPFSPINIRKPLRRGVPSLQHLCRLSLNSAPNRTEADAVGLPQAIKSFLSNYPNTC